MRGLRSRAGMALLLMLVAVGALPSAAMAQAARSTAPAQVDDATAEINQAVQRTQREVDFYLTVPAEWPLSPDLRVAAEAVLAEAAPRLRALVRDWALAWQAGQTKLAAQSALQRESALSWALSNRLLNEQAMNALDTAGPDHDAWRVEVESRPGWCRTFWSTARWGEVLLQIERLPAARRLAALQYEREVLARWGQARPAVPLRPDFSLDAFATGLLARVQQARPDLRPPVAMVPVVAATLLADKAPPLAGSDSENPPHRSVRCAALQWAQANARVESAAPAAELAVAFRYALMGRAEDLPRPKDPPSDNSKALIDMGYPLNMARRELTGTVQVQVTRDEGGRVTEARVVGRRLTAPGLEGHRPVFFETALDAASIAKARALPAGDAGTRRVEFVWKLE